MLHKLAIALWENDNEIEASNPVPESKNEILPESTPRAGHRGRNIIVRVKKISRSRER